MALLFLGDELITMIKDVTEAAQMTNEYIIYRYLGNEDNYLNGKLYYWTGSIFEPIGTGSGGGGGSSDGNAAVMTAQNTTGWLSKTISYGQTVSVSMIWSSLEDELPTGNGTLNVIVNGNIVRTTNVSQGSVSVNVTDYLMVGDNAVRLRVSDVYGNSRNINFTIKAVQLVIESNFDTSIYYTAGETINFTYTPTGAVDKTVHFVVDGVSVGTSTVTTSGRQQSFTLPAMTHGAHTILTYFEAEINGESVTSNDLYFSIIVVNASSLTPIISTTFTGTTAVQYGILSIPYKVYTPNSLTSEVTLSVNNTQISNLIVDRTEQTWSYRPDEVGNLALNISSGTASVTINLVITQSDINIEAETEALSLYLSSYGRSNNELNPSIWNDENNNISATLSNFNYITDGWVTDSDNVTVLRVSGDARVTIPYKPFANDFRTTGKTIEIEFATRNILNYDSTILSCMDNGRGFQLTAQLASLSSEQTSISTQYKEDEHVRIAFVVEQRSEHRLIYIYINGIMSGVKQYPIDDDFSQTNPVNISIGSNDVTTDIYCIRVYDNDLTRYQILDNWIADTQDITTKIARYEHNDVYDEYGAITIANLPSDLPYFVVTCPELPQQKGDKKTVSGYFVHPTLPTKSFSFDGAQADVQGTSSQFYARKNYKFKFNNGFTMTSSGETSETFAMNSDAVPTNVFTFKADVASSEGANNVELVRLYNNTCPYKTPPQETNPKVRQGIDGFPMVIFWNNGSSVTFLGKYNFNNDKGTEEVYGFADGDESWETLDNSLPWGLWQSDDYTGNSWLNNFEGRYPEDNTDSTNLQILSSWLVSTDQSTATGNALSSSYTDIDGNVHTIDNAAYRVAKFRTEASNHFELDSLLYYYLFTELFLMTDSRAKNAFPSFLGGDKWCFLPYDMDTAIGINNRGELDFGYSLEDIDYEGTQTVFNGQNSVLWINVRAAFYNEIASMYATLRSSGAITYNVIETMFEEHQNKWCEAIFNEDAWFKYIDPLIDDNDHTYLPMALGSKAEQRKWWLYNRFRYIDSKYSAGDSLIDTITIRPGALGSGITITPYADLYASVKWDDTINRVRTTRGTPTFLACPYTQIGENVVNILNCSQLASVGDLSSFKCEYADFSKARRLQSIKVGDGTSGYTNPNLHELYVGNSPLLRSVDARNCTELNVAVDLSGATNVEYVYFGGSAITAVTLPIGGILKTLELPSTVTNLTVRNQPSITTFTMPSYSNISTLRIENCGTAIPVLTILDSISSGSRVRIIGFTTTITTPEGVESFYTDCLDEMRGLDENGNNVENAVLSGTITGLGNITGSWLAQMYARYPNITIEYEHITSNIYYYNYDGSTLLYTESVTDGANATYSGRPSKSSTAAYNYTFVGWNRSPNQTTAEADAQTAVVADRNVYAAYTATVRTYTVYFYNGTTLLQTVANVPYGGTATYTGTTPVYSGDEDFGDFTGWNPTGANISGNTSCYAQFVDNRSMTRQLIKRAITAVDDSDGTIMSIGDYAFYYCTGLTTASLPEATSIGNYAFYYCNQLTSISLPEATSVGNYAFYYCAGLTTASLPEATSVGNNAFYNCNQLTSISLPVVTSIGQSAFRNCYRLTEVSLPVVTDINSNAFQNCTSLTTISLPVVTDINSNTFNACSSLTSISSPVATYIGGNAFSACTSLTSISLPKARSIGSNAFQNCTSLTTISLPEAKTINSYAFQNCSSLPSISLPEATSIGSNAFNKCSSLTDLYLNNTTMVVLDNVNAFASVGTTVNVHVPSDLISEYQADAKWSAVTGATLNFVALEE